MKQDKGFRAVFKREFRSMASSKICIWGIVIAPILSMLILMYMMDSGLPQKIPIAVVDLDNTSTTRSLVRQLDAFAKTDIKFKELSFTEARHRMERMEVFAVLTIPRDFTKSALSGDQPKLIYYTNNSFLISGSLLFQDLKTISTLASASVGLKTGQAKGFTEMQLMPVLQPISVQSHPLGNPGLNYSIYLNNIILAGILQLIIFLFTVSAIGYEIKMGSGKMLMQLGNGSIWKTLLGKLLPYTIVYILLALLFMSVLYGFNNFPLNSGFFPMFLNYVLLILASQAYGVIFIGVFRNYRFSLNVASLIGMLSFSIAGFSYAAQQMHPMLEALSWLFPLRHFFLIYVDQGLNGISMGYSATHYAMLLGMIMVSFLLVGNIKNIWLHDKYEL